MHCDEVIRELTVPTEDRDSAALAEHLASCPTCAGWAQRDAQFDRLWDLTRPVEPSAQVWETVWSHIASLLGTVAPADFQAFCVSTAPLNGCVSPAETPVVLSSTSSRSRSWNWAAIGLIGLAQAAAILFAVGLAWHRASNSRQPQFAVATSPPTLFPDASKVSRTAVFRSIPVVEIEAGQTVVIRVDDSLAKVIVVTPDGFSSSVDDLYLVFNALEAIANPVIAMKE